MIIQLFAYSTISTFLGLTFGALLTSYFKKKGENLATKEDFDLLLDQVKKTTHETETIKTELLKSSWVHQQQWVLRERYYIGLLENLYLLINSIESLKAWYMEPGSEHNDAEYEKSDSFRAQKTSIYQSYIKLKELHGPAELVISKDAISALTIFYLEYWNASEFSVCNSEWLDQIYKQAMAAHKIVLEQAKCHLTPDLEDTRGH